MPGTELSWSSLELHLPSATRNRSCLRFPWPSAEEYQGKLQVIDHEARAD
jgi:hypothetical protein